MVCRYYHFLTAMEAALPVGQDRRGVPVSFAWHDAFSGATHARTTAPIMHQDPHSYVDGCTVHLPASVTHIFEAM